MSIYATCWVLKFPRFGDVHEGCDWIEVIGQGVPAHIGTPSPEYGYETGDPYAAFLPPAIPVPVDYDGTSLRAMVVVRDETSKRGQEYIEPLLVLSGTDYARIPFPVLHERICDALRGDHPRVIGQFGRSDGSVRVMFEDSSTQDFSPSG
jgi:hypothetical protein